MVPTHFVCTVIYRINPANGELEFLVIDYRSTDPTTGVKTLKQTKFIGGTNHECPNETVAATRDREVWEETCLAFRNSFEIWKRKVSLDHTQYGFLVNFDDCYGELRKVSISDDGDKLSEPYWASAATLGRVLHYSHQGPYLAACRKLGIL